MDDFLDASEDAFNRIDFLRFLLLLVEVLVELSVLGRVVLLLHEPNHHAAFL